MLIARSGTGPTIGEKTVLQKTLGRILGCALLLYGGSVSAFTLIELQEEKFAPSSSITEATTLEVQVQPIVSTIRMQMLSQRRGKKSGKVSEAGRLLAANDWADTRTDFNYLAQASGSSSATGGSGALVCAGRAEPEVVASGFGTSVPWLSARSGNPPSSRTR